jgi:two-component system sensor histidine kinase DesK
VTDDAVDTAARSLPALRDRLVAPGVRSWYIGGMNALLWQGILVATVVFIPIAVLPKVVALVLLAVLYATFLALGPLIAPEPPQVKLVAIGGYWLVSALLFPLIGAVAIWQWLLVLALAAFTGLALRYAVGVSVLVVLVQLAVAASTHSSIATGTPIAPVVSAVVAASLITASLLRTSNSQLRLAHDEIARLAVVEERARFGRDLHDVLGHSLTVVTVKSDLARRLVKIDPDKAEAEIADIEKLARSAMADLRLAVANYREIDLDAEVVSANTALSAAGITPHLPVATDMVDPTLRPTFAWVLREGITNVIRHSGATECRVSVGRNWLTVVDDGCGNTGAGFASSGHGLRGLRERAAEVGATLEAGPGIRGGFELTARVGE